MKWHSLITAWEPDRRFIDVQLRGPYTLWHHHHLFEEVDGGTLIRDRVIFKVPFGQIGWRIGGRLVESDIREIFDHRARKTTELLEAWGTPRGNRRCTAA
jgi:ligand-binding SRPBCC domain-containing protein